MPRERKAGRDTWRSKQWFEVLAPSAFGESKIGETLALEPKQLVGRVMETTLGDLIDDFSKSHIKLYFQIERVEDNRARTKFVGHEMARDYIRSQIRRRASKVEGIYSVTTQDGYRLKLTSMVITLRRVQTAQIKTIRAQMGKVIEQRARGRTFDQFVQEVVLGKLASDIYKVAKQICPLRRIEVWKTKVLGGPA